MTQHAIILNGLARGGTNVVWNLLQSHPHIVSTMEEVNRIFGSMGEARWADPFMVDLHRRSRRSHFITVPYLRSTFKRWALKNLEDGANRYKAPEVLYTRDEVLAATFCFKGVCFEGIRDMWYARVIGDCFEDVSYINLVRNGFAVCEGWMRRGVSADKAGQHYAMFARDVQRLEQDRPKHLLIRFEDVLADPFAMAERLFTFADVQPARLDLLRLKMKPTMRPDGSHVVDHGEAYGKYWFTREELKAVIRPEIDAVQSDRLAPADRDAFLAHAREAMERFGYLAPGDR